MVLTRGIVHSMHLKGIVEILGHRSLGRGFVETAVGKPQGFRKSLERSSVVAGSVAVTAVAGHKKLTGIVGYIACVVLVAIVVVAERVVNSVLVTQATMPISIMASDRVNRKLTHWMLFVLNIHRPHRQL